MKYDPVDAVFSGLVSTPLKVLLGLATMAAMLAACVLVANVAPREWYEAPISWGAALFIFMLTIFSYWNDMGGWIALGLICFIGQWGALYAFVVSSAEKAWWYILASLSLACYFPVAMKGPWWYIAGGFALFSIAYWGLPAILARVVRMGEK